MYSTCIACILGIQQYMYSKKNTMYCIVFSKFVFVFFMYCIVFFRFSAADIFFKYLILPLLKKMSAFENRKKSMRFFERLVFDFWNCQNLIWIFVRFHYQKRREFHCCRHRIKNIWWTLHNKSTINEHIESKSENCFMKYAYWSLIDNHARRSRLKIYIGAFYIGPRLQFNLKIVY